MGIGLTEGLLIAAIVILCFGGKKIPELGRTLGNSMKGFKKGLEDGSKTDSTKKDDDKIS